MHQFQNLDIQKGVFLICRSIFSIELHIKFRKHQTEENVEENVDYNNAWKIKLNHNTKYVLKLMSEYCAVVFSVADAN